MDFQLLDPSYLLKSKLLRPEVPTVSYAYYGFELIVSLHYSAGPYSDFWDQYEDACGYNNKMNRAQVLYQFTHRSLFVEALVAWKAPGLPTSGFTTYAIASPVTCLWLVLTWQR